MRAIDAVILVVAALLAAAGQILFKMGANGREQLIDYVNIWLLAGLFSYGLGTVLWIYAMSHVKLSLIYPFTFLTFACVYAASVLIFKESLSGQGLLGVFFVCLGVGLISTSVR